VFPNFFTINIAFFIFATELLVLVYLISKVITVVHYADGKENHLVIPSKTKMSSSFTDKIALVNLMIQTLELYHSWIGQLV